MIRIGSLCSGYGGLELAVAAALAPQAVTAAWHAEIDPDASTVLKHRFPDTPNLGDLTVVDWSAPEFPCDLLAMGVPCQPVSAAGRQQVENDPRWLWPHALRALRALSPPAFVFENVRNLVGIRGGSVWAGILADMRAAGYAVRWLTLGACAVGAPHHRHRVFALGAYVGPGAPVAVRVPAQECGAPRGRAVLLASPVARDGDGRGEGDAHYWAARAENRTNGLPLGAQVGLLPTPQARDGQDGRGQPTPEIAAERLASGRRNLDDAAALLPTPRAGDAKNGHNYRNARGEPGGMASVSRLFATPTTADATGGRTVDSRDDRSEGRKALQHQVLNALLPTPRGSDGRNGGPNQGIASGDVALSSAVIGERFGPYAAAVERWEALTGRPAPEPTEVGPKGGRRLAAPFPEWMMGLEPGWITDVPGITRTAALRLAGNGVCPQQGARALEILLGGA